ncbi:hypothetical protein CTAYLR_006193 [Chrysophaeum taylorii]|uniref:NADP-dependent oxidoreductase domain-containing protein n=1 Tax=Chrysophaeum taylorii TaxID=2483200 RepID=A0AAD7XMY3_9STRA|nr:hypothetical protein CTAYLR_006193 [Chrysophaeum taylorii]
MWLWFVVVWVAAAYECEKWAREGECSGNPGFMLRECREECLIQAGDSRGECEAWAREDECSRNPLFMQVSCAAACGHQWAWVPSVRRLLGLEALPIRSYEETPKKSTGRGGLTVDADAAARSQIAALRALVSGVSQPGPLPDDNGMLVTGVVSMFLYAARLLRADDLVEWAERALVDDPRRVDWALRLLPSRLLELEEARPRVSVVTVVAGEQPPSRARGTGVPAIGLGTCWLDQAETENAVRAAIEYLEEHPDHPGIHIDSADAYRNERAIGRALAAAASTKPRRLFLASKISDEKDLTYDNARRRVLETLENFGTEVVHLYSLHSPFNMRVGEAWRALKDLKDEGKILALGVSNFDRDELRAFVADVGVPDVVQNKFDPYRPGQQTGRPGDPLEVIRRANATLVAYSTLSGWPFGVGALGDPIVKQIANRRGVSPATLLLRWVLDLGHAIIPRSKSRARVHENLNVYYEPPLDPDEIYALSSIARLTASPRYHPPPDTPDAFGVATSNYNPDL